MEKLKIGTCSWKYDSWKGLVYPDFGEFNYLEEYCKKYNTVEIDQWFWSLHPQNKITLPNKDIVQEYFTSTPKNFKFTIKVPNSITLTHPYKSIEPNKHFLSVELMETFLETIEMLKAKTGMLMFQFEYLNKQKMSSQLAFQHRLEEFFNELDPEFNYAIEIRNPNYLNNDWFSFLNAHNISSVFLQGYYMPNIYKTIEKYFEQINHSAVIRLHGTDRKGIENKTNKIWNKIVVPQDNELNKIVGIVRKLMQKKVDLYMNVNNHYEGSAPLTIQKIFELIKN